MWPEMFYLKTLRRSESLSPEGLNILSTVCYQVAEARIQIQCSLAPTPLLAPLPGNSPVVSAIFLH